MLKECIVWLILGPSTMLATAVLDDSLTFESLTRFLRAHPEIRSIEQFLSQLPETFRAGHTLMHESRSSQGASPMNPRVIMFGSDARFIMTFNGDPNHRGHHSIEMIQWQASDRRFEFRELVFNPNAQTPPQLSERNPKTCLGCHTSDPRPNWEHYPSWPGAYGQHTDRIESNSAEERNLRTFLSSTPQHPRYRYLPRLSEGYQINPSTERTMQRHNINFTQAVGILNFQRMARHIRNTPDYDRYKFAIVASLFCSRPIFNLSSFFPSSVRNSFPHPNALQGNEWIDGSEITKVFDARGISADHWFTNFGGGKSIDTPGRPDKELAAALIHGDSDFEDLFLFREERDYGVRYYEAWGNIRTGSTSSAHLPDLCNELRRRSNAALTRNPIQASKVNLLPEAKTTH